MYTLLLKGSLQLGKARTKHIRPKHRQLPIAESGHGAAAQGDDPQQGAKTRRGLVRRAGLFEMASQVEEVRRL